MALNRSVTQKEKHFWKQNKIKIASTLIAIFIWFLVVTRDTYEYRAAIPIQISQENPEYILTSPIPRKAYVMMQGSGRNLFSFMLFREGKLRLDVNWSAGSQVIRPKLDNVFLLGSAQSLTKRRLVSPDSIYLEIEKVVTREIPIKNRVDLRPLAGYKIIGDIVMEPETVPVRGPESAVAALDSINTEKEVVKDLKSPINREFELVAPDNKQITLLENKVKIVTEVQQLLEKVVNDVQVVVRYLPQNLEANVQPPSISVKVQGGMEIISPLTADDINVYVEYQPGLDSLLNNAPVQIEPIKEVKFRDVDPERVKVNLVQVSE